MSRRSEFAGLFQDLDLAGLSDAQSGCCMWLANHLLSQRLSSERVLVVNGDDVADRPLQTLTLIANAGGFAVSEEQIDVIVSHPSVSRYSKDMSISFNATSRQEEMEQLDQEWGKEAQAAIHWLEDRAERDLSYWFTRNVL